MHIDDVCRAIKFCIDTAPLNDVINIGSGTDLSIADFANLLCRTMGFKGTLNFDSSKPDGTIRKLLDISHAESLGWKHKIDLEVGIRQTYNWFVDAFSKGAIRGF
jgi:GDP-L-fucose synthase